MRAGSKLIKSPALLPHSRCAGPEKSNPSKHQRACIHDRKIRYTGYNLAMADWLVSVAVSEKVYESKYSDVLARG